MIDKVASALGRNDEQPNIALAVELVATGNSAGIRKIVDGLRHTDVRIVNDCIKVLYEIGERDPALITEYADRFIDLLQSKNNRLVWGAMTALAKIAPYCADTIFRKIENVQKAYENGSVITIDNSISVFAEVAKTSPLHEKRLFPVLLHHLESCRPKEVGQHAERAFICVNGHNADAFASVLIQRIPDLTPSQRKRVIVILEKMKKCGFTSKSV